MRKGSMEKRTQSNPNKANFQKAKMNVNSLITKDYRKNDAFAVRKNEANSKTILKRAKMDVNSFIAKDYENKPAFALRENKANQSQDLFEFFDCLPEQFDETLQLKVDCW